MKDSIPRIIGYNYVTFINVQLFLMKEKSSNGNFRAFTEESKPWVSNPRMRQGNKTKRRIREKIECPEKCSEATKQGIQVYFPLKIESQV